MKRIAYFGGTFDPVHNGHLAIARALVDQFELERFFFLPAHHAPHKPDRPPTSGFHRFAMLCLATQNEHRVSVSTLELETGEMRYTIDTLRVLHKKHPDDKVYFVMGADSWSEITTWREWESVLLGADHIVVSRPGYSIETDHVTEPVRERIRSGNSLIGDLTETEPSPYSIYFTDAVKYNVSATELREDLADGELERTEDVPAEVAKYIEKYNLYT